MKKYGTKTLAYRPILNSFGKDRELVQTFTIDFNNSKILHKEDGPAVIWSDGSKEYFINGFLHNENGPAIVEYNKNFIRNQWYLDGVIHREDGPAVEHLNSNGTSYQEYYRNGKLHREDGPAVIHPSGTLLWYNNGIIDRKDGPAIINKSGGGMNLIGSQWFINNKDVTKLYNRWANRRKIEADSDNFGIFRMEYRILGGNVK